MKDKKDKKKPAYNALRCVGFMLKRAWEVAKSVIFLCLVLAALEVLLSLAQLFVAPMVLEKVETIAPLSELLLTIGGFTLLLLLLRGLKGYVDSNTLSHRVDVRTSIVNMINHKACVTSYPNTCDPKFKEQMEDATYRTTGNDKPTENIWKTLTNLLVSIAGFVIYLFLLSDIDAFLLIVVIITTVVGFFLNKHILEKSQETRREIAKQNRKMWYIREKSESIVLAKDIRIYGLQPWLESLHKSADRLHDSLIIRREKIEIWTDVVDIILTFARNGIAYFYLINMALKQDLPASQFLLYFTAISGFTNWMTGILSGCLTVYKECVGISAVREFLDYPEIFRFEGGEPIPDVSNCEIKLENVTFRYPGSDVDIIKNMNLTIRPGEKLAVVGLNGAGKTTLVRLICGFFDPDEGRVLLNGINIRNFNRREYYKLLSAIFQDFSELSVTIAESVAQAVENIDRDRVNECLEKAGLTESVAKFPSGIDTHIGKDVFEDGVLLSGGQTQRLMLARALYKDGPILILDEPTAALDPIAEHNIYMKYNEMTKDKTSVFISHRLASTRFCDRIIFLADGVIKEEGTHDELLNRNGEYAKLFHVQSRYYQEGAEFNAEEI